MSSLKVNAVEAGLASAVELDTLLAQFLANPEWIERETRSSRRMVDQYTFDGDPSKPPPHHLQFMQALMERLLDYLRSNLRHGEELVPMQCFLCLYEDGGDSCPSHKHDCRQLTMSFGSERALVVENQRIPMRHGDIVVLDGERHGLPTEKRAQTQPRVSINLFFTTSHDLATREVSVNHRPQAGYQRPPQENKSKGGQPKGAGRQHATGESSHSRWGGDKGHGKQLSGETATGLEAHGRRPRDDLPAADGVDRKAGRWRKAASNGAASAV